MRRLHSVLTSLVAPECADCHQGMYWGNQNDGDWEDFYNTHFMGFGEADVTAPSGALTRAICESQWQA